MRRRAGTSYATPVVAGIAAMVMDYDLAHQGGLQIRVSNVAN